MDGVQGAKFNPWATLDKELELPVGAGGGCFCGVSQEQFAINGKRYQWPRGSKLTWSIEFSRLGQLSDLDVKDAISAFCAEIVGVCDVALAYVKNPAAANIKWITRRLDGPSGVLAQMQIPVGNVSTDTTQLLGEIDDGENWVLSENPPAGTIDFYRTGLHEMEHAMGLGHAPASLQEPALIAPVYSPRIRHLQPADIAELVIRYGTPKPVTTPDHPPVPVPGSTPIVLTSTHVVVQGDKKWQAETKTTLTRVV